MFGKEFKLVPCYVSKVDATGNLIMVSPWGDTAFFKATVLSPLPTGLDDGRRLQGIPSPATDLKKGDDCMCAVVDGRYYIMGYFNLPMLNTGETATLVADVENLHPLENGSIHKISTLGQIVYRKSNQIITWLGTWANEKVDGHVLQNEIRDETRSFQYANFIKRAWGGLTQWTRKREKDLDYISWKTNYTDVKTKTHELDTITDWQLGTKVRNAAIDDIETTPDTPAEGPQNPVNSNYIDKVITQAGTIEGDTHVYQREVRQSKLGDKEKTVFTTVRDGHRTGVLREVNTEDTLEFTETSEKLGAFGEGRLLSNEYKQYADTDSTPLDSLIEEFGDNGTDVYNKVITHGDNTLRIQQTVDGVKLETAGAKAVTVNIGFDGTVSLDAGDSLSITSAGAIDFNTGAGGFTVNGHFLATADFFDWLTDNATSFGLGNMGAPVPLYAPALLALNAGLAAPDNYKTNKV